MLKKPTDKLVVDESVVKFSPGGALPAGSMPPRSLADSAVFKTAHLEKTDDGVMFTMSTGGEDRHGDVIEPDGWQLSEFKKNPIALWQHDARSPIGAWEGVRVVDGRLRGTLKLAKQGTSRFVDTVRSLVEQGIVRAVSVGFMALKSEKLREPTEDEWFPPMRFLKTELLECSLVSVPANAAALAVAKSFHLSDSERLALFCAEPGAAGELYTAGMRASVRKASFYFRNRKKNMRISEQIIEKQDELVAVQLELKTLADLDDRDDDQEAEMVEFSAQAESLSADIERLMNAEHAMKLKVSARMEPRTGQAPAVIESHPKFRKGLFFAGLTASLKAHIEQKRPEEVATELYQGDQAVVEMTKAVSAPAMTSVTGWAEELVRESFGEYLELLKPNSVYPNVPGMRHVFGRSGKITIPTRDGTKMINGDFVAEGAPIPVKQLGFKSASLTPKKLAVISTFTREIAIHSTPAIEGIIREAMLDDTREVLDALFLDNTAASTTRPAGLQKLAGSATSASAGTTPANIQTDIKLAVSHLVGANMGNAATWIMNPAHRMGLAGILTANGNFLYRDEINAGTLAGYRVLTSNSVPSGLVFLVDNQALTFANDFGPEFRISDQATLHMEDTVADVKEIVDNAGTPVAAHPVRSLYQTDTIGIRMVWGLDWAEYRTGGIYILTGVSW